MVENTRVMRGAMIYYKQLYLYYVCLYYIAVICLCIDGGCGVREEMGCLDIKIFFILICFSLFSFSFL